MLFYFFSILKTERCRLVMIKNQRNVADNKAYRAVQIVYVNCKLKA